MGQVIYPCFRRIKTRLGLYYHNWMHRENICLKCLIIYNDNVKEMVGWFDLYLPS